MTLFNQPAEQKKMHPFGCIFASFVFKTEFRLKPSLVTPPKLLKHLFYLDSASMSKPPKPSDGRGN